MGRRRRRRRHREASMSAIPSCAGNIKINEASAMLLYEAPSGIAIFSFDEAYLNNPVKDFWADTPQLILDFFLKYEGGSTPIDLVNDAIDESLTKELTRLCGSGKKLVVGNDEYKKILEKKLEITCLHVDVLDCEVIKCCLKNPMRPSLPEEKSKTSRRGMDATELIKFLRQHDFDVNPEMVSKSIAEQAHLLRDLELCEMAHLKFFRILLRDFIVKFGVDTKSWRLLQFAAVLKMICCPGSAFRIYPPVKIFSHDEYQKILADASKYKISFDMIDALSVYEDAAFLCFKKSSLMDKLNLLVEGAKVDMKINEVPFMLLYEAPSGIAIFSFDGAYLNNSVKDFWADIPWLNLEEFMNREKVPTPFGPGKGAIDDHLAEMLTRHCGTEKKLVVGSTQHKTIIEDKLGINCLCADVPDRELIKCSLKNPMPTLLPEEKLGMSKRDFDVKELITFLHQHDFDVKPEMMVPEMVSQSIAEKAHLLLDVELCEMAHLKFFRILLRDFIIKSGVDTKDWRLFQFATVLKMICCPRSSFRIYHPVKIFSRDEYRKILANASQHKTSFSKIDALSVYEDVVSLYSEKSLLMDDLDILVEEAKGDIKINEARSMLLYEAPSGIAIFSSDGAYLNNSMKDFWADIPQLTLEEFIKREEVSTPFDPANESIDDHLAKMVTRHCGSEKKLVVGSALHKTIIEKKLGITCLYVDVPYCELINCSLKNPMHTSLPEEKSEMSIRGFVVKDLITFLHQHDFDVKPEMVSESIAELADMLLDVELCEMEHLKFFRILLRDFIVKTGIDTKNWVLLQFATVPKMICCPGSSCQIYPPVKIFSSEENWKIEANAFRYKTSFCKIDALSVYEDVVSLYSKKRSLLQDLDSLVKEANDKVQENLVANTDSVERNKQAGDIGLRSIDDYGKTVAAHMDSVERNKQAGYTGEQSMDDYGKKRTANMDDVERNKQAADMDDYEKKQVNPASVEITESGRLIDLISVEWEREANEASANGVASSVSNSDPSSCDQGREREADEASANCVASSVSKSYMCSGGGKVSRRSKAMTHLRMVFNCVQPVH